MTSVEKRRSGRKSGGHRKHSDGGYSDTSSGGSFLDETDREVSNLTDRAFRSLCIGDEAVYNDSDLCSSSPCVQRDRQLAFSQSGLDAGREDREREELKRAAHESFSLRMQQYGQDWIHGGMYGAEIHRDPQWGAYGERTQGRISATFQHSFVETSQQEESLRREQLSFLSNGATELGSQQRRSRSRVSSLIKAFNSEGYRDGAGMDGKHSNWNDETSWDKSALMSIQRELSEFSTSYQQNFNSGHFPPTGPFSPRDTNFYSSEVAAMTHMNSESSFMRSSHSKHSMSAQFNSNSNFFIHSEFSPFKVWRDHNRFPFQQGEVSGFMHCSEFPKWYETPMYKELSLEAQPQGPYRFEERGIRHPRNNLAPVVPPAPSRSTSTSTMLQKAMALEKRCESELAGHYPHRKRTQSLGANRLPSQRPSTASPSSEMSRRVQDTISSVKALQQKIKMMAEQNTATGMMPNELAPNVVSSSTSTTPFNISHLLTPSVNAYQDIQSPEVRQSAASPQPVEHPPVRAESRGATPDVRMSSYKSRATSLLFNLKDNRKRVKSTYSPTKFKSLETVEKNKQPSIQEPRDTVIDIPDYPDPDSQYTQVEESGWTNAAPYQFGNQYHNPGLALPTLNSQPATAPQGQYSEYSSFDYRTAQMQGEMVHHSGFTGFIPENYASNQLANGQNLNEDLSSFTPYKQGMTDSTESMKGDVNRVKPQSVPLEMPRLNADSNQMRDYLPSKANTEHFNETVGRDFTKADKYQQLKENKHDYSNVSSRDRWRQTNNQDTENLCLKTAVSPWKQEITASMENDQHAQGYQRATGIKEEPHLQRDKYRGESQQNRNKELDKTELRDNFGLTTSSHKNTGLVNPNVSNQLTSQYPLLSNTAVENPARHGQHQPETVKDRYVLDKYHGHNEENEMKDIHNYNRYTDQDYRNLHTFYQNKERTMVTQDTNPLKQIPKDNEMQNLKPKEIKPQLEHNMQENSLSNPHNASAHTMANRAEHRPFVEVKAEQAVAEHLKAQHAQAELAKAQHWAQVEQPKVESAGLILAEQTGSEQVKEEQAKAAVPGHEISNQAKTEHITDERRKIEQTEQTREEQFERAIEEHTKAQQNRVQVAKPKNITAEAEAQQMRGEQGEQVKAEDTEAGRLKGEHIKSELAKTEQAGQESLKQAKTEPAKREKIKAEQHQEEEERAEQVEREQREVEQIRTEEVKAEQAETERGKAEQAKLEPRKEHQVRAEQKIEVAEDISVQWGQVKAELPPTQLSKVIEEQVVDKKVEQTKLEQSTKEQAKTELNKTENVQERSAKPAAKLTVTQEIKSEPDKVEQVKTELAKAKAELAKIKEKMRGEQKEKVRNPIPPKGDASKKEVLVRVNTNEKKDQDQATQKHQQKENSGVVSKKNTDQAYRGGDEYKRLRDKYGFTEITPTSRNELSIAGNASSNDTNAKPILSLDKAETTNNEKLKDKHSPTSITATANAESKEELASSEVTESHYVYSESSKEFKLSSADYVPTNVNSGMVTDKVKDDNISKLEMSDPLKQTNVSQQRDSDLGKPPSLERKSKSTEHSVGSNKDFTPPKALSNKERAQTKQEILTSKIKAHAEKEISAIKEKGFALRDGIISKNSIKQLTGSQSINIRQKPPSQELPKKNESTVSSNITPKQQTVPPGTQVETFTAVLPSSSATMPVKSAATNSQKNVPKEITKSNVSNPKDAKQTGSYTMSTEKGLLENQNKEHQSGLKSPMQEQTPKNKPGKQEANHGEISAKQKEGLKDNCALNTANVNKKKEDPQATDLVKAESSKLKREKAETKHEAVLEDTAPSINILHGHNETPAADDSLQITGIMVTVRERQPSVNNSQGNNNTQEQITSKAKDSSNSVLDKYNNNPERDLTKGSKSLKEISRVKADDSITPSTHPSVKEDQTKDGTNNHPENMQQTSVETRQNNMSESATVKRIHLQASSSTNAKPQRDTRLQEPIDENVVPSTITAPAKNKVLAETQPLPNTQDTAARETKDYTNKTPKENSAESIRKDGIKRNTEDKNPQKRQTAHISDNLAKMVNTGTNSTNDSNRAFAETVIKHDTQSSVEEDMTTVKSPSKSRTLDGENAPPLEEKRHNLTQSKPLNKNSPSNHLAENENRHVSSKHQHKETLIGGNNQEDNEVHIGSIAIRVVPPVTDRDNLKVAGTHHGTTVPSVVADIEHELVLSSSHEEKMDTSNQENKGNAPVSSEKHSVLSSVRTHSENTKVDDGKCKTFDRSGKSENESKIQPTEGDYFQVQGVAEANNEPHKSANVGDTADSALKQRELPGLQPKNAATSNKSYHEGKNEALNQSKTKIAQSSSASIQDENTKRKNKETEDNLALKQSDDPTERWTNKNERKEASLSANTRKQHTENQSSLSGRERQNRGNSDPPKENTVKEKPEVKPKPKERVSTIPEISALADYARLKVIVSEDRANTIQEFTPNKKEGFFPLIQTRQSRRPVFTADPQDLSTKEKSLPIKTEVSSKVNKEPKPLAFPITDREHQRTGMFKLGDKERQEKILSDAKANENDTGATHAQHLKERNKLPTPHLKNQGNGENVLGTDTSTVHQVDLSNKPTLKTASSSAVNKQSNPSVSQLKPFDNFNPQEKPEEFSSKTKRIPDMDKNSPPKPTVGQEQNIGERTLRKDEKTSMTLHEETKDKQSKAKPLDKEITHEKKEEKRAEHMKIKTIIEESRASLAEEERKTAQREEERRAREREAITNRIKERRERQREAEKRAEEERKAKQAEDERVVLKEEEMRLKKKEEVKMKETEENRRIKTDEDRRAKVREEEKRIKEREEKRVKQQEEERAAQEEQQRRAVQEEQQRRAALIEEQQRRAAQEEQKRRAAKEEQQRRAAEVEQQRRAAEEEQQRRAAEEEQQRRAALFEEQRRKAALVEEQQRRAAQEEKQRRAAQEEQQRRAAQEEQQRRAAQEEQQRRAAEEEQQRRTALFEEQRRKAALVEEQQRRAAQEEQQRRAAQEEQQRRAAQEEQQRKAALVEEQQRRAAEEEQQRRAALVEEQQRRAAQEEQQRRAALSEEKGRTEQIEEKRIAQVSEEEMVKQTQQQRKAEQYIKEQRDERHKREEWMRTQREEGRRAVQTEKSNMRESGGNEAKDERTRILEKSQAVLNEEENRYTQERALAQREDEIRAKNRRGGEKLVADREKDKATPMEEQKRMTQQVDSLQYYAITSTESEIKPSERQVRSPLPSQRRSNPLGHESAEDYHNRSYRPHAPPSPAPSMPRSNTSSPALGYKPSMFRVKDNTFKGSSFTKSVKPRFHKNFGEDFRVGSPMGSERGEEEAEILRRSAVTPVHPDTGLSRLSAIKESSAFLSQDHPYPHHRPYSRRSIALDEDDSRSVISNVSEDVESFATSAADLADIRGLYDYERPESACSFSSDVSRSLGKPPAVPPKSEKALRRAKRLTTRRIKKELSKAVSDSPAGVEKPPQEPSSNPSSSSTEVWSSNRHAVASPHFSPPVSLANAPPLGSRLPASHTEHQSSHSSFYASPHATGPISLPAASPHATAPVSIPVASPHATGLASHPAAPKIVADVPSSPTLHHANHPAPVTQYHVESSYPSSYPLTQRKVLQDLGSGQYFVVDVPVQVKTKTFFDPETGKYVQLNVRESSKSTSRSNPQQTYLQPQIHAKPNQQQALSQDSPAGKHNMLYQGYHGYPQGYQPAGISSVSQSRSSSGQQPVREDHSYGYPAPEMGQNSEGHRYSPEKTPYMDTVNDTDKPHNTVYNTHGSYESFPECDTNSQLAGSSVCENDNSAHSQYQPRDIIAMSELEDFMELSDW